VNPLINHTPAGTEFAMLPPQTGKRAPLLLLFAMAGTDTLTTEPYCRIGYLLHAQGWNVASLDLPCHGADQRAGELPELQGWAERTRAGENFVVPFQQRVYDVVDHLVHNGTADPARIAAAGTSRGGYLAFQAAASSPRIRAVAAFAPVTDPLALSEFSGQQDNPLAQSLTLVNTAASLAARAVWITIGNTDDRVDTDRVIAFARALTRANQEQQVASNVTLHLLPSPGHCSFPEWHDEAAIWFHDIERSTP
jgi:dienelactone hydrolase